MTPLLPILGRLLAGVAGGLFLIMSTGLALEELRGSPRAAYAELVVDLLVAAIAMMAGIALLVLAVLG